MATTTNYQCPNCNGRLFYSGDIGKLQCEFCGSSFAPQEIEALYADKQAQADAKEADARGRHSRKDASKEVQKEQVDAMNAAYDEAIRQGKSQQEAAAIAQAAGAAVQPPAQVSAAAASMTDETRVEARHRSTGDPIQDYLANSKWSGADADNMRAYNCPSCGAQLMVDQVTAVTSCPYCGNNTVVPGQLSDVLKPDYVIPFKLDKNAAINALKEYYGDKKLLPNTFTDQNHLEEIQGVYVPFWLYSGEGMADATFNGRNITTWSDSENVYTKTDHFILQRRGTMQFNNIPVDGSTRMPDAHMDAIEPFDYSEMVPFSVAYLPGYVTDRYDQDVQMCSQRATNRACATCESEIAQTAGGYMEIDVAQMDTGVQWRNIAYALLPVWMLHTKWNGQDFLFAMNGQTGKFIGDLPVDNGKAMKRFLMLFLPLAIILIAIVVFMFWM